MGIILFIIIFWLIWVKFLSKFAIDILQILNLNDFQKKINLMLL